MASVEEVETVLEDLLDRLAEIDDTTSALLPSRRTIEARCPDLDLVRLALWDKGRIHPLESLNGRRPDIRISVRSSDLLAMAAGDLTFARAYASNRVRLDASMGDLLRLRAVL